MISDKKKSSKTLELDSETASKMLDNVFQACNAQTNSIPLDVLTSYSNYRKDRFLLQKIIAAVMMLVFCMVPLLFIMPKINIQKISSPNSPLTYEVSVKSIFPVHRITATIGGRNIPIYETAEKVYSIEPPINGLMNIEVTSKNRQTIKESLSVSVVDVVAPVLISSQEKGVDICLYLSDADSGIDYPMVIGKDVDGKTVKPTSYDESASCVVFTTPKALAYLKVYIPDRSGNILSLILNERE